jgi:hypothetical protein
LIILTLIGCILIPIPVIGGIRVGAGPWVEVKEDCPVLPGLVRAICGVLLPDDGVIGAGIVLDWEIDIGLVLAVSRDTFIIL